MDVRFLKQRARNLVARVAPDAPAGGTRVLLYHAIDDRDPADPLALRVSQARFLEQMQLLSEDGYQVVPLAAVADPGAAGGPRRVAITFDDGYRSQAWAAERLREFGFPATFFLVPHFLDGVRAPAAYWEGWGHLHWEDAQGLLDQGFEVGAHSTTHPDLRTCADPQLDDEVAGAKARLETRFGAIVESFSYPFGRHDERVRRAVERAGYRMACTSRYGVNRTAGPSYAVRRTEISGTDDVRDFRMKLAGRYDWLGRWQELRARR